MNKLIICLIYLVLVSTSFGQEQNTIATGGNYSESNTGSISYTIGETIINTLESPDHHITQGFNQDWIHFLSINNFTEEINIKVYPNPTTHFIHVESNKPSNLKIYDINGKEVLNKTINTSEQIDLTSLLPATYFLKFIQENKIIKSVKIVIL